MVEHCTENENYGKCEICEHETYSSEPNGHMTCERCTSCSQINGTNAMGYCNFLMSSNTKKKIFCETRF